MKGIDNKGPQPGSEEKPIQVQRDLDFRTKEEKKRDLREKIARERIAGNFLSNSLSEEEKELFVELAEEDREDDQPNWRPKK